MQVKINKIWRKEGIIFFTAANFVHLQCNRPDSMPSLLTGLSLIKVILF